VNRLRLPLRLARREVRRRPGRTTLVALLVALPVAGMAIAVTLIRTDHETPLQEWTRSNGQAEAAGFVGDLDASLLPAGARQVAVNSTYARVKDSDGHRADAELSDLPLQDPIATGIYDLVAGRPATAAGEVVLSTSLADHLEVDVGDDLTLERPAFSARVVGEIEPIGCLTCGHLLVAPGQLPTVPDGNEGATFVLIDLPADTPVADLVALQEGGLGNIMVRDLPLPYQQDDGAQAVRWSLVLGALVLTVVGIVISAAFAVGARRQLVTLGQLSASGASPATVRTALVLQGTVTGLVGAAIGLALGVVLLLLGEPLVERVLDRRIDGYTVRPLEVVAVVAIGIAAATLAALIPARTAARIPTLAALAGRRPLAPVSRRLIMWGFVSMTGGLALLFIAVLGSQSGSSGDLWAMVAIVGGVGELLGACAIAPAIVARLEPLATRLRGSLRLGARSLARHRARTGAVVSAVAAAGALAVAAGGLILGSEARAVDDTRVPDDVLVVQSYSNDGSVVTGEMPATVRRGIEQALPGARESAVRGAGAGSGGQGGSGYWTVSKADGVAPPDGNLGYDGPTWERAIVADEPVLDALRAGDEVRDALADTGLVVHTSRSTGFDVSGDVTVTLPDGRTTPGVAVGHRYTPGYVSQILITEDTAADLDLELESAATLFDAPDALTAEQRGAIEDLQYEMMDAQADQAPGAESYVNFAYDYADGGPTPFQLELILSGVALVFSLFVVGVSLALAAAESKDERDVLTIAGAPPGTLARSAGARAWLLALIGAAMAVPVGFLPVVVFGWASDRDQNSFDRFPLVFPTRTVLLLLVVVPMIVAFVSWSSSATAQRLRPVRVSTATFE
jgi:putative ABC transport system permease protein